jgi:hypothetical protein
VQRQRDFAALVGEARFGAGFLLAQQDESVDCGVYSGDPTEMRVDQFNCRDFAAAKESGLSG